MSGRTVRRVVAKAALAAWLFCRGAPVRAASDGFFATYTSAVERGEVELTLVSDFTRPSAFRRDDDGFGDYVSHMLELEYGMTDRLATELMIEWFEDVGTGDRAFTGFRWEARYRLFRKQVPLNPMFYVEYADLDPRTRSKLETSGWVRPPYARAAEESDRERVLETRLVFSHELGPLDLAFNWINETELESRTTAFGYSVGLMKMMRCGTGPCGHAGTVGLGLEAYGGLGDTQAFGFRPARQEHYLGPLFMYHVSDHWTLSTQVAIGVSKVSDQLVRLNLGYEF